jgi:folate-dependent tRNA-U54 methylase TrmFO/GidA
MGLLMQGVIPEQYPAEGPQVHLQRLQQLLPQLEQEGTIDQAFMVLFNTYVQKVQSLVMQTQMLQQQAAQFAGMMSGGGGGGTSGGSGEGGGMTPQPQGQLMDESLPGAKGMMGQGF